jgi:hypothetical protein
MGSGQMCTPENLMVQWLTQSAHGKFRWIIKIPCAQYHLWINVKKAGRIICLLSWTRAEIQSLAAIGNVCKAFRSIWIMHHFVSWRENNSVLFRQVHFDFVCDIWIRVNRWRFHEHELAFLLNGTFNTWETDVAADHFITFPIANSVSLSTELARQPGDVAKFATLFMELS